MVRKRILVTGASSGLGLQMAREFAARGRSLALAARRTDRLEALREELVGRHPGLLVRTYALDVNDCDAVFEVFGKARAELGGLDRVVVNAGQGGGRPIGTGAHALNLRTAQTNFLGALSQCEAAMTIFREQQDGHLVLISSVSALAGLPRRATVYAATKAGLAHLGAGLQAELTGSPITVSTILPGYILTEMTDGLAGARRMASLEAGTRSLVAAIERERPRAVVPAWPWVPLGVGLRLLPPALINRIT